MAETDDVDLYLLQEVDDVLTGGMGRNECSCHSIELWRYAQGN